MAVRMGIHAGLDRVEDPAERLDELVTLREFEQVARSLLDPVRYDHVAGGARDEHTVRENERAFARVGLVPRVLRGVGEPALRVDLPGTHGSWPVVIAPTAFHGLAHPEAERATARAAAATGTVMIAAMLSTVAIEDIAAEARTVAPDPALWFQLYPHRDPGLAEAVVRRAEDAGVRAFTLTVDSPEPDLPPGVRCANLDGLGGGPDRVHRAGLAPGVSWRHVEWLRGVTGLPIVLKGVLHPDDARLAVEHGADGLIVSNHGGRGLGTAPPTIDRLPVLADAVAGRIPLLLDGGVRRGTDVVKALALGASAVAVGRPVMWGLATAADAGVRRVLDLLRMEVQHTMILCGCPDARAVPRDLAVPRALETAPS
jgi:4-hydroxymandelate oxidase